MALPSTQERPREVYRYQPLRCLRCADLDHDNRSLAHYHRTESSRWPLGLAAVRLASRFVRVCSLHHRSIVLHSDLIPSEFLMTVTEVRSERDEVVDDLYRDAPSRPPESRAATKRRVEIRPFLITLAAVALAGLLGWAMW